MMPHHVTGRLFAIELKDHATIRRVSLIDMHAKYVNRMLDVSVLQRNEKSDRFGSVHDLRFENILIESSIDPIRLWGRSKDHIIQGVSFENVSLK